MENFFVDYEARSVDFVPQGIIDRNVCAVTDGVQEEVDGAVEVDVKTWLRDIDNERGYLGGSKSIDECVYGGQCDDVGDLNLKQVLDDDEVLIEAFSYLRKFVQICGGDKNSLAVFLNDANWLAFCCYFKFVVLHVRYKMKQMEDMVTQAGSSEYVKLREGWKDNCRFAAYCAAIFHFGAIRKAEEAENGKPKYYVRHVIATAVNEAMGKVGVFDDKFLIACFLHDSKEDYHKSPYGLSSAFTIFDSKGGLTKEYCSYVREFKRRRAENDNKCNDKAGYLFKSLFGDLDLRLGVEAESELTLEEILDVVTKASGDRAEAMLIMFEKIVDLIKRKPSCKLEALAVLFFVKFADRLNNIKTFFGSPSAKDVHDETAYVMKVLSGQMGMVNVEAWFDLYLRLQERHQDVLGCREAVLNADRVEIDGELKNVLGQFRDRFACEMRNNGFEEGSDYRLIFRLVDLSVEGRLDGLKSEVDLSSHRARRYYVLVHSIGEKEGVVECAKMVLGTIFKESEKNEEGGEICDLEKVILDNGGQGVNNEYGCGMWAVFSEEEGVKLLYGHVHAAMYYNRSESLSIVSDYIRILGRQVGALRKLVFLLKPNGMPEDDKYNELRSLMRKCFSLVLRLSARITVFSIINEQFVSWINRNNDANWSVGSGPIIHMMVTEMKEKNAFFKSFLHLFSVVE